MIKNSGGKVLEQGARHGGGAAIGCGALRGRPCYKSQRLVTLRFVRSGHFARTDPATQAECL